MSWQHRDAVVGQKRLRLGVGGPSRSGKTYSSLRIATGIAAVIGKPIFLIDTDNEFALDYASDFKFQHVDFQPPFTSERYIESIEYCVAQGAGVIVVDQITHEHTGPGGMLERQEIAEEALAQKWKTTRDKTKAAAWVQAKAPHGKFVSYVTRVKQPMIFNFRCKDKVKIVKGEDGKQEWVHMGYTPICAEQFDYEMTAMLVLPPNSDGVPDAELSEIRKPLRPIIKLGQQIDESLGRRLAEWAAGGQPKAAATQVLSSEPIHQTGDGSSQSAALTASAAAPVYITPDEALALEARCTENGINVDRLKVAAKVERLALIESKDLQRAKDWIDAVLAARKSKQAA